MLLGESVDDVAGDLRVDTTRGVLPIEDPALRAAVEEMESAWGAVAEASLDGRVVGDADRRAVLVRMESVSRAMYGTSHTWLTELVDGDGLAVLPERSNPARLACLLRIDSAVAGRRIKIAGKLARRRSLTGEQLDALLPVTARAQCAGHLDAAHVRVIEKFFDSLPAGIDHESLVQSEILLVDLAKQVSPEQLTVAAHRLTALLDPDGELRDKKDIARKCFVRLGPQEVDGTSKMAGVIDAEFRAYLGPVLAKLARKGVLNPDEPKPVHDTDLSTAYPGTTPDGTDSADSADGDGRNEPNPDGRGANDDGADDEDSDSEGADDQECDATNFGAAGSGDPGAGTAAAGSGTASAGSGTASTGSPGPLTLFGPEETAAGAELEARAGRDLRTQGQRNHDAVKAVFRQTLAAGTLGTHRGLPVTAVISMSASDLATASGHAVTGTGSLVSIRDAIRMAAHAHHYLAVFDDDGRALYLGRGKRLASADQRIVLIARDRGCSFPNCTRPATWSQVHHIDEWADGGNTDIDDLTFGCDCHHPLVGDGPNQWATTTTGPDHPQPGRTAWHPPESVDPRRNGLVNHYHHPQEYLYPSDDPDPETRTG
ncbi:HNH endonuclease signature motif containing protein [Rhodococcoides fascians]|uniref:HNH endonuclease signature motif containing protein n=1 Tax=Rhodococcoides fascians TaxID=1828 RepID=UPI0018AFA661|nr:HNH endonuclease signature motif containing protein [Rhodococcus fascians]